MTTTLLGPESEWATVPQVSGGKKDGMKVTAVRKELLDGLQIAARVAGRSSSLPTLRNVLIETLDDFIRLSATNLELNAEVLVPATIIEAGKAMVPAESLRERIASLPEADVELKKDEERLIVTCRRVESRVLGGDPETFASLPEAVGGDSFSVSQPLFKEMIAQASVGAGNDDTRPILTGVLVSTEGAVLTIVSTDTHKLSVRKATLAEPVSGIAAIVPADALSELAKALSDDPESLLQVTVTPNLITFKAERLLLCSRLIEGLFPRFERVIPSQWNKRLTINRDELITALKRVRVDAKECAFKNRVVLEVAGETLKLTAYSDDGNTEDEIEVEREGGETALALNSEYALSILGAMHSVAVYLEMTEPLSPVVFRPADGEDYLCVIMPMQQP